MKVLRPANGSSGNAVYAAVVPVIIILALLLVVVSGAFVVVNAGHVGVVKRLGAVQPQPLDEGMHFKRPFMDQVEVVDVRLMSTDAESQAASRDLQTVSTKVNVTYSLNGEIAPQTIQRIGDTRKVSAALIEPAIQESVKAVTAKFTAEELVTKRSEVKTAIQAAIEDFIAKTLEEKDVQNAVSLANVAITDFEFSRDFNLAIEAKVKAEQEALRAKNEKLMRVTQAEAKAAEEELAADAQAYKTEVESKARAEAIRREAEALKQSPEIIQLRAIEKWDGVLPRMQTSGVLPFLDLGTMESATRPASPPQIP